MYEVTYGESSISEGETEIVSWLGVNVRNFVQHRGEDNVRGRKIIKGERGLGLSREKRLGISFCRVRTAH